VDLRIIPDLLLLTTFFEFDEGFASAFVF